jgi:hypothetical protein
MSVGLVGSDYDEIKDQSIGNVNSSIATVHSLIRTTSNRKPCWNCWNCEQFCWSYKETCTNLSAAPIHAPSEPCGGEVDMT